MRNLLVTLTIAVLMLGYCLSCNRHVESLDPVRDLPSPLAPPVNLSVLIGNQAVTLTWEMTDQAGVAYYRVYAADSADAAYTLRDTSSALTCTVTGLLLNREYFFKVAAVRSAGTEGRRSASVSVRIPAVSVVIARNDEFTNSRSVEVTLNAGLGATEFQLSEDSTFSSAPIENFTAQARFELSAGDAIKRVYARFYYGDGSRTNAAIFDEITLDTRAMISSFTFAPTSVLETGDTVTFTLTAGESKGAAGALFAGAPNISLYDDGVSPDATANDGIYTGRWVIPIGVSANGVEVEGKFTDGAGNEALPAKAPNLMTIRPILQPVSIVSILAISTYQIDINWTQATTPDFRSYRLYRGTTSNVTASSTLVTTVNDKAAVGYTDTSLSSNTMYYYRVYLVDSFGVSTPSNVDSARTQVNVAPDPVTLAGALSSDSVTFKLSWTKSAEVDFASYRLYRKNTSGVTISDQLVQIINDPATDNVTDFVPGPATVYYRIFVFDRHGLNAGSNEIQLTK